jgi:hypothetical protein
MKFALEATPAALASLNCAGKEFIRLENLNVQAFAV